MVDKDKVRAFVTFAGTVIGEEMSVTDAFIKMKHPFRLFPTQEGKVAVGALFVKEEWCNLPVLTSIEIDVTDGMKQLYAEYESQLFGSILAPSDRKLII